jgi:cell fate (sporulation/competence/biofilm development) regulator YlbF (YheA/YmcA/DUF963 family)
MRGLEKAQVKSLIRVFTAHIHELSTLREFGETDQAEKHKLQQAIQHITVARTKLKEVTK